MMLRKMVDEYETIKIKMNEAKKQFGSHHDLVEEYRNQLDDLCTKYFGNKGNRCFTKKVKVEEIKKLL